MDGAGIRCFWKSDVRQDPQIPHIMHTRCMAVAFSGWEKTWLSSRTERDGWIGRAVVHIGAAATPVNSNRFLSQSN